MTELSDYRRMVSDPLERRLHDKIADLKRENEALRQRADAGVRAGMERAAEIAWEAWCNDYATAGIASRLIKEAAALPAAVAKDEKGKLPCP